jgi:carbon monoxide dehydrogenase subunit G
LSSTTDFTASVRVARPAEDVFAYIADPRNFPEWNSAVDSVVAASPRAPGVGMLYVMRRQLPSGRATNELEIIAHDSPGTFAIRTTSGPTPFVYRFRVEPADGGARITLTAEVELAGLASIAGPLVTRAVKRGVDANLATLRAILERPN